MNRLFTAVLLAVCVSGTGCGKKAPEKMVENIIEKKMEKEGVNADVTVSDGNITIKSSDKDGGKTDINMSPDKMTISSQDGKSSFTSGSEAKIPDNFPKDVHVYAESKILTAITAPKCFSLTFESKDNTEKILSKYRSEMPAQGWEEEASLNMEKQAMIAYKKDTRTATIIISTDDKTIQINLTVMDETN